MEETIENYEGQDIPTADENSVQEGHETTLDTYNDQSGNDFNIPLTEDGEMNYDDMSEEQLDTLLAELEASNDNIETEPNTLPKKFKDVDSLVKSYELLESRMGNFVKAPDEYNIDGVDMSDPIMSELGKTAKDLNMSNEAFSSIVNKFNEVNLQMEDVNLQKEMGALGEGAETRIANINNYIDNNVAPHIADSIRDMATNAQSIEAIESLIQGARPSGPTTNTQNYQAPSSQDIQSMMYAKDDYGNLKMETDSGYHAKVMAMANNQW